MKKITFFMLMLLLLGRVEAIAQVQPNESVGHNAYFIRLGALPHQSSWNVVWLNNMQDYIETRNDDLKQEARSLFSAPFELGLRHKDWFTTLNITLPIDLNNDDGDFYFRHGTFMVEKSVLKNRNFRFNTGLGITYYDYAFQLKANDAKPSINLDDLANARFAETPRIYTNGFAWDLAISWANREKRRVSVANFFRFGYRRGFNRQAWSSKAFTLTGSPLDRLDMAYFQYFIALSNNR